MIIVSIIIPVYNAELYLERCLTSIQQQTYTNIEVLCVNDGSTDMSGEIISKFTSNDSRFIHIYKEHSNAGEARNVGLKAARGAYLLFLDSDDFFDIHLVTNTVKHAQKTNADITVFQYKIYNEQLGRISLRKYGIQINRRNTFNLLDLNKKRLFFTNIAVWNKLYRTSFIRENNLTFKSHPAINDIYFSWGALICAKRIALCRHVGTYYRINTGRSISDNFEGTSRCFFEAFAEINEFAKSIGMWEIMRSDLIAAERKQAEEFLVRLKCNPNLNNLAEQFVFEMEAFMR